MQVRSQDGSVYLSGKVGSRAEKLLAERVTQSVEGVKKAVNNLSGEWWRLGVLSLAPVVGGAGRTPKLPPRIGRKDLPDPDRDVTEPARPAPADDKKQASSDPSSS